MNTQKIIAESIAKEYLPKEEGRLHALKKLDTKVKRPARIFAYLFGSAFSLVAGTGMCLAMQVIGSGTTMMIVGIAVGLVGFTVCAVNYPIYRKILQKRKEKYAYEIVELARRICEETDAEAIG
ncbi:MAG: dihydropteridine reductase [Clostridia bacterium]|nr:dihydropteridine reductase [Clostridia bacterium]